MSFTFTKKTATEPQCSRDSLKLLEAECSKSAASINLKTPWTKSPTNFTTNTASATTPKTKLWTASFARSKSLQSRKPTRSTHAKATTPTHQHRKLQQRNRLILNSSVTSAGYEWFNHISAQLSTVVCFSAMWHCPKPYFETRHLSATVGTRQQAGQYITSHRRSRLLPLPKRDTNLADVTRN